MRQMTFIWMLGSPSHGFHQSTQCCMVVRLEACGMWGLERHGTIHCVASLQHRIICLQVLAQGQVRNMTPQQVVRQIPPLTALPQGVPGTVSSAILFSAPGVTAANLPRPGIVQVNAFLLSIKKWFQGQKLKIDTDSVDVNSDMNDNLCSFLEHPCYLCVGHVQGAFNCPHQNTYRVCLDSVVLQALLFQ